MMQSRPPPRAGTGVLPLPMSFEEPYRVLSVERLTATILELWLTPLATALEHLAGEYVLLEGDGHERPPRSYSIANAPRPDGLVSLLVTRVPGGESSTWIHDRLRVGDEVSLSGPYGAFVDDPASTAPALFLAAGSGLAPIRSLIEAALSAGARRSLTLIFSARTEGDVIDGERFESWRTGSPHFRFIRTLTRASGAPPHGRIPVLLPTLCEELSDHDVFVAGAPQFVSACARAAEALQACHGRLHTEVFFAEPQLGSGVAPHPDDGA